MRGLRLHEFNSRWWGAPAGVVTDPLWLSGPPAVLAMHCAEYAWVEYIDSKPTSEVRRVLQKLGFVHADTQLQFRVDLRPYAQEVLPCGVTLGVAPTAVETWKAAVLRPFVHERYSLLAGCSEARLTARYAQWAAQLAQSVPATSLEFRRGTIAQGWFLSHPSSAGLELTLAMTALDSSLPGATLYRAAIGAYARRGFRLGYAGFSATNHDVHNIYSALGARFTGARECWLWQSSS